MWFDPHAKLAEIEGRAAIRQFDGGQDRETAERAAWQEARRAAGITALDDWRREADDAHNPDNWQEPRKAEK